MKIIIIVGARPQFIKAALVSREIRNCNDSLPFVRGGQGGVGRLILEVIVHTGQHYDYEMDKIFFDQLDIPKPDYHLGIGSGAHGVQIGRMLAGIEEILLENKPSAVVVYGDTNSTLAGALAAAKCNLPVAHIESGMRSFNRQMPEEINRILTDHIASWHFCPTETAVANLKKEGITKNVHLVGDVMYEAVLLFRDTARANSNIMESLGIKCKYALATIHRAENTDELIRLRSIAETLVEISNRMRVIFPVHPRTKNALKTAGLDNLMNGRSELILLDPLSYLDMIRLEESASIILTDSGGVQKEASWLGVPCITIRDETEWLETVSEGFNVVAGTKKDTILAAFNNFLYNTPKQHNINQIANASEKIISILADALCGNQTS